MKPRGGKREGAGRKPRETPLVALTIRLEPIEAQEFRDVCKATGVSQAGFLRAAIKKAKREGNQD